MPKTPMPVDEAADISFERFDPAAARELLAPPGAKTYAGKVACKTSSTCALRTTPRCAPTGGSTKRPRTPSRRGSPATELAADAEGQAGVDVLGIPLE